MIILIKDKLSGFIRYPAILTDIFCLSLIACFFLNFLPVSVLNSEPATGGDTGSHFWPLVTLVRQALPEFALHVWNPGNLGGEPQLVHYFPLPYLIMAFLSVIMPLGTAFNLGTLLPLFCLPFSVYFSVRLLGLRWPAPVIAASFSLFFLYNESYSMWGGNTLSTLAGQFAHSYALNFLVLAVGLLHRELRTLKFPYWSGIFFAAVVLSHGYVMFGIPLFMIALLLLSGFNNFKLHLRVVIISATLAFLFSAWFLIPMLDNAKWTIPFFLSWKSPGIISEVFPQMFIPVLCTACLIAVLFATRTRENSFSRKFRSIFILWLLPSIGYGVYYLIFPSLGLIDVRALPQCQLFICILSGAGLGYHLTSNHWLSKFSVVSIVCFTVYWVDLHISNLPQWLKWNYSGWTTKPACEDLSGMYNHLRGDFSMLRVAYEHSPLNSSSGTIRVFEMLPYFANRATLESVYLQASILAPAAFLIQAEISKTPSCPFIQFSCAPYNLSAAKDRLDLLGVGQLILVPSDLIEQARSGSYLIEEGKFGPWYVFAVSEQPKLAEVFTVPPKLSSDPFWTGWFTERKAENEVLQKLEKNPSGDQDWQQLFYAWLRHYETGDPMMLLEGYSPLPDPEILSSGNVSASAWLTENPESCQPEVQVNFNHIRLKTKCPGKAHFLKFAYHSTWKTNTGDLLFLLSPGFIGLIPSQEEVTLSFGVSWLWRAAGLISILSFLSVLIPAIRVRLYSLLA